MALLTLVRHGQASYGAQNYDKLSDLGWRQSRWLGEHFAERGIRFDRIVRGSLVRHAETLQGILEGMGTDTSHAEDAGLNEYDSHSILAAHLGAPHAGPQGDDRRAHFRMLRDALYAWADGKLQGGAYEPFTAFRGRVMGALQALQQDASAERVLVVSSGGPIATFLSTVTGMPQRMMVDLNLQTRNGSFSEFRLGSRAVTFISFNNVPHLDRPDREGAVTYA